jgi:hypothetical protein
MTFLRSPAALVLLLVTSAVGAVGSGGPVLGDRSAQLSIGVGTPKRPPAPTAGGICANLKTTVGDTRYCVSSVLPQDPFVNRYNYGPESLFDNSDNTAWVEGVDGQGIGEWIVAEFDQLRLVRAIEINNGYNKDPGIYQKNSRVKGIKVEFSGRVKQNLVLKDTGTTQLVTLPGDQPVEAYWIKFTIESVYPGSKFEDTAISELHIVSDPVAP